MAAMAADRRSSAPCELRLYHFTPTTVLSDPELPQSWVPWLQAQGDRYGLLPARASATSQEAEPWDERKRCDRAAVVVAGREPLACPEPQHEVLWRGRDKGEAFDFLIPALEAARFILECQDVERVTLIARAADFLSHPFQSLPPRTEDAYLNWKSGEAQSPPKVFELTGVQGVSSMPEVGQEICAVPPGKKASYSGKVANVHPDSFVVRFRDDSIGVREMPRGWPWWAREGGEAQREEIAGRTREARIRFQELPEGLLRRTWEAECDRADAAGQQRMEDEKWEVRKVLEGLHLAAARRPGCLIWHQDAQVNPETVRQVLSAEGRLARVLLVFIAAHGMPPDSEGATGTFFTQLPYPRPAVLPRPVSGCADMLGLRGPLLDAASRFSRADLIEVVGGASSDLVVLFWGTCYGQGMVSWVGDGKINSCSACGTSCQVFAAASADPDKPTTATFMDAWPVAAESTMGTGASLGDLVERVAAMVRCGGWAERLGTVHTPEPASADQITWFASEPAVEQTPVAVVLGGAHAPDPADQAKSAERVKWFSSHPVLPQVPPAAVGTDGGGGAEGAADSWPCRRALFESAEGADLTVAAGGAAWRCHRALLLERSPAFWGQRLGGSEAEVRLDCKGGPEAVAMMLLMFYCLPTVQEVRRFGTEQLMQSTEELGWHEATARWLDLRGKLEEGGLPDARGRTEMRGSRAARLVPGWIPEPAPGSADALTFSFEVEGRMLRVLSYFRPYGPGFERFAGDEGAARWLEMGLAQRWAALPSGWMTPLERIDADCVRCGRRAPRCPGFFNPKLHPEANGTCWEIIYGGQTPGYTVDLRSLFDDLHWCVDDGLSLADLRHDSGIQVHVAFPFMREESVEVRRQVLALLVHANDWMMLRNFEHAADDTLNVWYTSKDAAEMLRAAGEGAAQFDALVTKGSMPNPELKHKALGLRGRDVYKEPGRYGVEIRRGYQTEEELEDFVRCFAGLLCDMGRGHGPRVRLTRGASADAHRGGYLLNSVVDWVAGGTAGAPGRSCPEDCGDDAWRAAGIDPSKAAVLCAEWVAAQWDWADFDTRYKKSCFSSDIRERTPSAAPADCPGCRSDAGTGCPSCRVKRSVLFVLASRWELFPSAQRNTPGRLRAVGEEQAAFREAVNALPEDERRRDIPLGVLRLRIVEFARRLARLY
eukprot:TRINITY_DN10495_c0_g1_i2.p1 TRINITY_DN10495_c0_g1~~TRINITY_DN10495_c0_g1_i2.p1  ORF type:complete len:1170 (+),score=234.25 TRINITY_DN10495_c0_g1_i2:957-4466(+)